MKLGRYWLTHAPLPELENRIGLCVLFSCSFIAYTCNPIVVNFGLYFRKSANAGSMLTEQHMTCCGKIVEGLGFLFAVPCPTVPRTAPAASPQA